MKSFIHSGRIAMTKTAWRRLMIVGLQAVLIVLTYYFSFLLRFDFSLDPETQVIFFSTLSLMLAVKLAVFWIFGLMSGWWRYVGISDAVEITKAALSSSLVTYLLLTYVVRIRGYPRSVYAIDLLLTVLVMVGARLAVRAYREKSKASAIQKNTLVVGAGRAGGEIVRKLKQNPDLGYRPIGFVDDDVTKAGIRIHGIKVLGSTQQLPVLIERHEAQCVLIAMPSARGKCVERIVSKCRECAVEWKTLQAIGNRIGRSSMNVRGLRVEDLLGREPVRLDLDLIRNRLRGKVLLITGAGGSIGSELARQVAQFDPEKLVLFERSENDLFKISVELSATFPQVRHVPVVGDILDVALLREIFALHRPHSVFHAAAYKHVPMMETNCFQAVTNNVFGTYNVALVSRQFHVEDFVLISSDKAVNPTNVMGVTKRVGECIVLALQNNGTRFVAVRFGNVLGSNGSVVPLFEQQIAKGGPVLVTHPQARRYFMTIPEAVQLVLQASSMGCGGEIFILRMGQQVRIAELAENLIRLSGYEPGRDIEIVYTGLRPGEKLFEELQLQQEDVKPTSHEKLYVLDGGVVEFTRVLEWLDQLERIVEAKNVHALVTYLNEMVPEYTPSKELLALCELDRHDQAGRYRLARTGLIALDEAA
jgi:FlaA1/EpsC-like NDP-sugar epimerase